MKKLLSTLLLLFLTVSAIWAADKDAAKQDLQRAIRMMDATMERSFRGDNSNLYMADVCDIDNSDVSGPSDIWPYTAAIEAHCSILEALEALKDEAPDLYTANHDRFVQRLDVLIDNMEYYRGTYTLTSYASVREWSVYAVPRANERNMGNVDGIVL